MWRFFFSTCISPNSVARSHARAHTWHTAFYQPTITNCTRFYINVSDLLEDVWLKDHRQSLELWQSQWSSFVESLIGFSQMRCGWLNQFYRWIGDFGLLCYHFIIRLANNSNWILNLFIGGFTCHKHDADEQQHTEISTCMHNAYVRILKMIKTMDEKWESGKARECDLCLHIGRKVATQVLPTFTALIARKLTVMCFYNSKQKKKQQTHTNWEKILHGP